MSDRIDDLVAAAIVNGTTGTFITNRRCNGNVKNGAGDHSITLDGGGIDSTECMTSVIARGAASVNVTVVHTSDTVKQILMWDNAGVAIDNIDFEVSFRRVAVGTAL